MSLAELEAARQRIDDLDARILELAAQRIAAARAAGRAKASLGLPTVDYQRERLVLERARAVAARHGLATRVAEDTLAPLMAASVAGQDADRLTSAAPGKGRTAVVVGGAGRMGRWFVAFLRDAGYSVTVNDPQAPEQSDAAGRLLPQADLVVVATPPSAIPALYSAWASARPRGLILDVASIKAPFVAALRRLQAAGARVASCHPMFGPGLATLRGADVVLCRTGDSTAEAAVRDLFSNTSARLVELDLDDHDRVMADALALPHAAAIAYAVARAPSTAVHSTTQRRLAQVADGVAGESPSVYFEIQAGNPHAPPAVARLRDALERVAQAVRDQDGDGFAALLREARTRSGAPA